MIKISLFHHRLTLTILSSNKIKCDHARAVSDLGHNYFEWYSLQTQGAKKITLSCLIFCAKHFHLTYNTPFVDNELLAIDSKIYHSSSPALPLTNDRYEDNKRSE